MNTTVEYVATPYWLTTLANSCSGRTCARARWRPPVEAEEPVARHGRAPALGRGGEGCKVPPVSTHTLIGVCRVCCNQTAYLQGAKKNRAPVPLWNPVCMRACCAPKVLPMPKVLPPPTPYGTCDSPRPVVPSWQLFCRQAMPARNTTLGEQGRRGGARQCAWVLACAGCNGQLAAVGVFQQLLDGQ